MQFSQRVQSITQDKIVPKVFDNILSDNFLPFRLVSNGKSWVGESLKIPVKLVKSTNGGSFSGLDTFATSTVESRQSLTFEPKAYAMSVVVPGLEKLVNATTAQVVNLVKAEMESSAMDAADDIADLLYDDGTGNGGKDFDGFGNLIDDGTVASTVGGLSRTTYPTLAGYRLASGGLMNLTKLGTMRINTSGGSSMKNKSTLILSDETRQDLYMQLLNPTVRANYETGSMPVVTRSSKGAIPAAALNGAMGFTSVTYSGIPWVADEKCTSDIWFWNENYFDWYGITDPEMSQVSFGDTHDSTYNDAPSKFTGLQFSGMMRPVNQYGDVGQIFLFGNATTSQPRRQGIFTGVTTI